MEEILFSPDEIIFKQQEVDDSAVYYIVKGSVQLLYESKTSDKKEYVFQVLNKKQYFGEISFLTGQVRGATARASDFCRLFKIKRDHFLDMVKKENCDYENFQMVKEAVTLKNNLKFASIRCYQCNQGDHLSIHCPKTQLTLNKQIIFQKHNFSVSITSRTEQQRRKKSEQYRTRLKLNSIQEVIFNFINNPDHQEDMIEMEKNFLKPEDEQIEEEITSSSSSSSSDSESERSSTTQLSVLSSNKMSDLDAVGAQIALNRATTIQRKSSIFATTNPRGSIVEQKPSQTANKLGMHSLTPSVIKYSVTDLESDYQNKKRQSQMQFVGSYNQINVEPNYHFLDSNQARYSMSRKSSQLVQKQEEQQYSINFVNQIDDPVTNEPKKSISASVTLNDKQLQQIIAMTKKEKRKNSYQPNGQKDKEKDNDKEKEKEKGDDRKKKRESSYKQRKGIRQKNDHIAFSQMPNLVTFQIGSNPLIAHNPLIPIVSSNLANSYSLGYSKQMSSNFNKQYTSQTTGQDQRALHYITLEEMNRKFDKLHNFKTYYPHNNSTEVVAKYSAIISKNIDKLISRKLFKYQVTRKIPKKMNLSKNNLSFNKDFGLSSVGTPTRSVKKLGTDQANNNFSTSVNLRKEGSSTQNLQVISQKF